MLEVIPRSAIKRRVSEAIPTLMNLIRYNEKPLRIVPKKSKATDGREPEQCISCQGYDLIIDSAQGCYVCQSCGVVSQVPIYQELSPFLWGSVGIWNPSICSSGEFDSARDPGSGPGKSYLRYFHFNEILAAINLKGPRIPNSDMRVIREHVRQEGIRGIDKPGFQRICRKINKTYHVRRFAQRYGEKWIQIGYRTFGERPPEMSPELIQQIQIIFRSLVRTWFDVRHLIKGSKKGEKRHQWPNYIVTINEILRRCFPRDWELYKDWLPLLSDKKLEELKPCFDAMFY